MFFENYKFRASGVGNLMVGAKANLTDKQKELLEMLQNKQKAGVITDKQLITLGIFIDKKLSKPKLSKTAKSYLQKIYLEERYGKKIEIATKQMDKGTFVEDLAITLYSKISNELFFKNKKKYENNFVKGTPDNVSKKIIDIKSSWNAHTFPMFENVLKTELYKWQVMSYMWLTGIHLGEVAYCLVNTPEHLILDELRRFAWKNNLMDLSNEQEDEIRSNFTFNNIPEHLRVKKIEVIYNEQEIELMIAQIQLGREYLIELESTNTDIHTIKN